MSRKLPPLNSLRAFESAARHLSFTKAANELCVTQAAISHQVKILEGYLKQNLFIRLTRELQLTDTGRKLLPVLTASLDSVALSIKEIKTQTSTAQINVRLPPSFASKWLSPRMMDFWRRYPEVSISLQHGTQPVDFANENIDIAITYGRGKWSGVQAFPVMTLDYFPVASPEFLQQSPKVAEPKDMANFYLLHDANYDVWPEWFAQAGEKNISLKSGYIFDDTNVLIQAALDGQGFALCSSAFVDDHIAAGRLVKVFEQSLETDYAYHICYPKNHLQRAGVSEFRNWLLEQVANT